MEERDDFSAPCRVRRLVVRGARHTKEHVVRQQLAPLESARTLGEIGDACLSAAASLRELDIFDSADVLCDAAAGAGADADGVPLADVVVTVAEKKRLTSASTGVSTQGGEGSLDASVSLRNLLGRAERFDLNMETGQQKSNTFRLSVLRPRWMGRDAELRAELSKQNVSHLKHSSHIEKIRGGTVGCRLGSPAGPLGSHDVSYAQKLRVRACDTYIRESVRACTYMCKCAYLSERVCGARAHLRAFVRAGKEAHASGMRACARASARGCVRKRGNQVPQLSE